MRIHFSDGVKINTDGPYRVIHRPDGYYVVGHGMLEAVGSHTEGNALANELRQLFEREVLKNETR